MKTSLIKRNNGKYSLTSLGKILYDSHSIIEKAQENYWKLKAIDSLEIAHNTLPQEEHSKIIDTLIDNHEIKEILVKGLSK